MAQRIDDELDRIAKRGETPKTIYVGSELYFEVQSEQNTQFAADIVRDGQPAQVHPAPEEPTEYNGIRLVLLENEAADYLRIET